MTFLKTHKILIGLLVVAGLLALIPVLNAYFVIGDAWRGVPQSYLDEILYYSHMGEVATGNLFFGNPYLLEHRFDPPIIIFGSDILAAIPLFLSVPLEPALVLNSPREPAQRGGSVVFDLVGASEVGRELNRRRMFCDHRPGVGLRIAPHFYTKREEIDLLFEELKQIRSGRGR